MSCPTFRGCSAWPMAKSDWLHTAMQLVPSLLLRPAAWAVCSLSTVLLVAGCAPHTRLQPTHITMPSGWPADSATSAGNAKEAASLPIWSSMVQDPALHQLLAQASAHNHALRLALLRAEEAHAAYGIERANRWPTVAIGSSHARARVPGDLNASGQPVVGSEHQAFVGMNSWELDLWGRVRSLSEAALQQYLATEAGAQAARQALLAQVARAYVALREADDRLHITRSTMASRAETLRIFTRRYEVGSTSKYALSQVQSLYHQAQAMVVQIEQTRAQAAHALHLLTGADISQLPAPQRQAPIFAAVPVGLPSSLLTARPDIQAAEHQLQAAHAHVDAARAAFFPRIVLSGSWGSSSAQLDGLFDAGSRSWSFMPSISLPIFDGGQRQAQLDLTAVRQHNAVVQYEQTVQNAFREVADALSTRHALAQQVDIQHDNLSALQERARLAQLRYDSGASPYLDVLDAQRDLLSAAQQVVQVRYALQSTHISLYTALGGGTTLGIHAAPTSTEPH